MNIRTLESLTKEELIELVKHEREHIAGAREMAEYEIWGNFPGYLIDHCEGEVITEEFLQNALSEMLNDPKYLKANEILNQDIAICEECGDGIMPHNPGICGTCYGAGIPLLPTIPEGWKLVPVERIKIAIEAIQDAMSDARNNGYQECCGRGQVECCGDPDVVWIVEDQRIMDALSPAQRELSALLAAPTIKDSLLAKPTDSEMLNWLIEKEALICHSVTANLYEIWFDIDNVETGKTAREAITKAMRGEK